MLKIRMSIQGDLTIFLLSGRIEGECISDRKSTRLNSSHTVISYAVFCLKKKQTTLVVVGLLLDDETEPQLDGTRTYPDDVAFIVLLILENELLDHPDNGRRHVQRLVEHA